MRYGEMNTKVQCFKSRPSYDPSCSGGLVLFGFFENTTLLLQCICKLSNSRVIRKLLARHAFRIVLYLPVLGLRVHFRICSEALKGRPSLVLRLECDLPRRLKRIMGHSDQGYCNSKFTYNLLY